MTVRFDGRVAVVTGAGQGLGRAHALGLAARGARIVVNDLGSQGGPSDAALETVALIAGQGGEAFAHGANVAVYDEVEAMVNETLARWGRVDILVNNAGILRAQSFAKMDPANFALVVDVHLKGAFNCSRSVWGAMREQGYGRIVMTTSSSGLYGNFGQANYSAAKMGLVGLMNTMVIEGERYGIRVNSVTPIARTSMTEGLMDPRALELFDPADVTVAVLALCAEDAPNRTILSAGAGCFGASLIHETPGLYLEEAARTPETLLAKLAEIVSPERALAISTSPAHTLKFVHQAASARGVDLSDASWGPKG